MMQAAYQKKRLYIRKAIGKVRTYNAVDAGYHPRTRVGRHAHHVDFGTLCMHRRPATWTSAKQRR